MIYNNIQAIVLAAGKSTRFNTGKTKLLEKVCGKEMILYATDLLEQLSIPTTLVIGYQADAVKAAVLKHTNSLCTFVEQREQKGTGDAVKQTQPHWHKEHILIMNGDMPLINNEIIHALIEKHRETNAVLSFVTAHNSDSSVSGYGRVIHTGNQVEIAEAKDFTGDVHEHCCINAGIYIVTKNFLEESIHTLSIQNAAGEFYITDLVKIASLQQYTVSTIEAHFDTIRGINTFKELWAIEQIKRAEIISQLMHNGVRFNAAHAVVIDVDVTIGAGSFIGYGVHLVNGSHIGAQCIIEPFSIINGSTIGNRVTIRSHSIVYDSTILDHASIGPFAHINTTAIDQEVIIGNFVEVKRSIVGKKTKAKHLSFIGNATIGSSVNIGAGTITCNYNGISKHTTVIHDHTFIGSNNTLIAPVVIGEHAYTAAGSVITTDVPQDSLAIGRSKQINKEGYASKMRNKKNHPMAQTVKGAIKTDTNAPTSEGL